MSVSGSSVPEGNEWDNAVEEASERMATDIKEDIDREIVESVASSATADTKTPDVPKASDYMIGNTREEGELYCDYRARLYWEGRLKKRYFKGRAIWIGKECGPMYNTDRMTRTNKKLRKIEARQEAKRS